VYEESEGVDEIIGVLYTKDLLRQLREGYQNIPVRDLVRPAYFVPETKKLDELLREIRQNRIHMVVVVDEYGSVAGLVTIEDLVEEIVGDIQDEYDHEEKLYEQINENEYVFDAKISIYDFNELMDMNLDDSDYETLGGFVYAQLGKIPNAGDTIEFEKLKITVLATRGRRITKIRVERIPEQSERESETKSNILLLPSPERESDSELDRTEANESSEANEPSEEASSWR
jgi:CBS domain containing-hemolysin-like protein